MRIRLFVLGLMCFLSANTFAQDQAYFQQHVAYTIEVALDDQAHSLTGHLSLAYTNNSPDVLDSIYMHVWPNAYKNGNTALCEQMMATGDLSLYYAPDSLKGNISALNFKVDGLVAKWVPDSKHIDYGVIHLATPLQPGGSITISTPFNVKIPSGKFSRLGHIGQSYQITQWYPKPAVYDREGWHPMPYLNQGEFYSEFGSFDVSITLPANYVLGATGDMVDAAEELEWLNKKVKATEAIEKFGKDLSFPPSSPETKTIRFKQDKVHDFAWFADKRYHVLKGEIQLPNSPRTVTSWAMFTNAEADLWKKSIEYLNDATYYYSLWTGPYPYNNVTAVDGTISAGGGMEYPNITVIGGSGNALSLETVIMHEVGHNWFYGILGSNERVHPWMDEGLNSYTENRYLLTKYPDDIMLPDGIAESFRLEWLNHQGLFYLGYILNARRNFDQPIELHSADYTSTNYGAIVYGKTALVFTYLLDYLGPETFDNCMHYYYDTWKFKHPQPADVRATFEKISGEDLGWFFEDMINSTKHLDYKIASVKKIKGSDEKEVKIVNKGDINGPYVLTELNENDEMIRLTWYKADQTELTIKPLAATKKFRIDPELNMPETNRTNNTYKLNGLFKKYEKPRLQFLAGVEDPDRSMMYWSPAFGFNESNHMMLGVGLYNSIVPQKKFEFAAFPMYSFSTGTVAGYGELAYNLFPQKGIFRNLRLSTAASSFHFANTSSNEAYFYRVAPKLEIDFGKKPLNKIMSHSMYLRAIYTAEIRETVWDDNSTNRRVDENLYSQFHYEFKHKLPINPYTFAVDLEHHREFLKANFTFDFHFNYDEDKHGMDVRFFGGKFFSNTLGANLDGASVARYNWQMDGQSGLEDYTFSAVMADRRGVGSVFDKQFIDNHGAFKVPAARGTSNDWLGAMNIKSWIPIVPFNAFVDVGWNPIGVVNGATGEISTEVQLLYDAGVYFSLMKDQIEIYVPLTMSKDLQSDLDFADINFWNRIRFTFNLHNLNPLETVRKINP